MNPSLRDFYTGVVIVNYVCILKGYYKSYNSLTHILLLIIFLVVTLGSSLYEYELEDTKQMTSLSYAFSHVKTVHSILSIMYYVPFPRE
jgi:hypothetical protein